MFHQIISPKHEEFEDKYPFVW